MGHRSGAKADVSEPAQIIQEGHLGSSQVRIERAKWSMVIHAAVM